MGLKTDDPVDIELTTDHSSIVGLDAIGFTTESSMTSPCEEGTGRLSSNKFISGLIY
jgi:hypothetical protein